MLAIYSCTLGFIFSAGLLINAWDFTTEGRCRAAIDVCLVFYVGGKVFLYLFLVERSHQLVATKLPRHRDPIYLLGIAIVLFGFGVLAVFAFIHPVTSLSKIDGKCRIGLPLIITIPLLSYDIIINFALTFIFVMRGARLVKIQGFRHAMHCITMALPFRKVPGLRDPIIACEFFMGRSGLGASAIILPTIANLAILFALNGHENGWLCFTICTIDSEFPVLCHVGGFFPRATLLMNGQLPGVPPSFTGSLPPKMTSARGLHALLRSSLRVRASTMRCIKQVWIHRHDTRIGDDASMIS